MLFQQVISVVGRHPGHLAYSIGGELNWDTFNPVKTYLNIRISNVWPLPSGLKLFYLFDFGDNWLFQINKTQHEDKDLQPDVSYPRVIAVKKERTRNSIRFMTNGINKTIREKILKW